MVTNWVKRVAGLEGCEDRELLSRARAGDDQAIDELLARYRGWVGARARSYFLAGAEREDVVQEAMIGLYRAIRDFDLEQDTPFRAFAELCISRQLMTAIKTANRFKHGPLNSSISLDAPVTTSVDHEWSLGDALVASPLSDPAEVVVSAEDVEALRESMRANLTELEGDVLHLYMDGRSYEEIGDALGNHVKSIDNALQRIKRKVQRHIESRVAAVPA